MYGWAGTIVKIDLTARKIAKEPLDPGFAQNFLGGQGFNEKIVLDHYDFHERNPYSPKNLICVSPGGLSGTLTPGSGRLAVSVALSPSLGGYLDANAGGHFAAELKYANYDAIVITGQAESLVYVRIEDNLVEIRDARHLRGKRVKETARLIAEELGGSPFSSLIIGPAGENRVHGSMATCDLYRAPSGGSIGAVFGSKNLKGIVVKGTRGIRVAHPEATFETFQAMYEKNRATPRFQRFAQQGTKWLVELAGVLNCQYNVQPKEFPYQAVSVERFLQEFAERSKACHACFQHCDHHWSIKGPAFSGERGSGGEAGTVIPLGPLCGGSDYAAILHLTNLVNDLGLDSIATGSAIATLMHWWQEGFLTAEDTGGLLLEWGNLRAAETLIQQLAHREGFGALLADGIFHAAEVVAARRSLPVTTLTRYIRANTKRREVPADFRPLKGLAFSRGMDIRECDILNTDTLLADGKVDLERFVSIGIPQEVAKVWADSYITNPMVFDDKSLAKFYSDNHVTVCNSLGICQRFTTWAQMPMGLEDMARCFNAVTGLRYTWHDLYRCGDRIRQLEQAMQLQFGFRKEHDYFPDHCYNTPVASGRFEGAFMDKEDYTRELENLYRLRGWDKRGFPTRQRLEELGLPEVAERLSSLGLLAAGNEEET